MCAMGVAYITPPLATRGFVCPLITYLAPPEISAIDIGTTVTTKNTAWMDQTRDRSALPGRLSAGYLLYCWLYTLRFRRVLFQIAISAP